MQNLENLSCDIVVIGAGGSGLAAAVRAMEIGAKNVIVLEKNSRPGGNAWLAVCMFGIKKGTEYSTDLAFKVTMAGGRWIINPKIIRAYFDKCGEVTGWLEDKGMEFAAGGFELNGSEFPVLTMPQRKAGFKDVDPSIGPGFIGSTIIETMSRECEKLGIKVLTKTKATRILTDCDGKVNGVLAKSGDKEFKVKAKAVIIASGGFGANEKMMRKYFPEFYKNDGRINRLCMGSSTGDGIIMAEEVGALVGENLEPGIIGPSHHPWAHSVHEALLRPECVWVNKNGERFVDEAAGMGIVHAMNRQPGGVLYALIDEETKKYYQENPTERQKVMGGLHWLDNLDRDLEREAAAGERVKMADTWEEIAGFIGAKPEVVSETIARYNSFCEKGRDADFLKDKMLLRPLRTPPFYAILGVRFCHGTNGGIMINHRLEVVNKQGQAIGGLYATGDIASGKVLEWALPGTHLGWSVCSGYLAGENAVNYISEN